MQPDLASSLDALRARGAQHVDPVRWRLIEALARYEHRPMAKWFDVEKNRTQPESAQNSTR